MSAFSLFTSRRCLISVSLASILKKKTLAPSKLDEIKIKANIIASFAEQKLEDLEAKIGEAAEAVESAVNREKAEL